MIAASLTVLAGLACVLLLYLWFRSRHETAVAEMIVETESEAADFLRKDDELNRELVDRIAEGEPLDQMIHEYQSRRTEIFLLDGTGPTWDWGKPETEAWKKREQKRRRARLNRQHLLPAVGGIVLAVAATVTTLVVLYNFASPQRAIGSMMPTAISAPFPQPIQASPVTSVPSVNAPSDSLPTIDFGKTKVEHQDASTTTSL